MLNELNFGAGGEGGDGTTPAVDLCPAALEKEIDAMNDFVYEKARSRRQHAFVAPPGSRYAVVLAAWGGGVSERTLWLEA